MDAVFRAFFQQGLDIGSVDVLKEVARGAGLPEEEFAAALREGRYTRSHEEALRRAHELGVRAVPTILVGNRRIEGMPNAEALKQILEVSGKV